ncbi:MAG: PulJ/GspJ family protein [Candidatus Rifleibacteriota bacterium]
MRRGFNLIELMVGLIIFSLLATALFYVYRQSRHEAAEIMANQQINDEFDRILLRITEDVRESNYIDENFPPTLTGPQLASFQTDDPSNYLMFTKVSYDFTIDPIDLPDGTFNYTQQRIRYFLEKEDDTDPESPWVLCREMLPFDNKRQPIHAEIKIRPMLDGIQECLFYRLKDPDASRSGNLYIKLKMSRTDKKDSQHKYSAETLISVKERGAQPQ